MRIISGKARGARLFVPPGEAIRPLSDLMRGAIFSRLGATVVEARVLDLFAGTGAFGLEALSRGAAHVTLVEKSRDAIKAIERNVVTVMRDDEMRKGYEIVREDAFDFIDRAKVSGRKFDIVFAGPPYAKLPGQVSLTQKLLQDPALTDILNPSASVIVEHYKTEVVELGTTWRLARTLSHGHTRVELLFKAT